MDDRLTERALGYLRMFVTLMVVAHHAMLAYHPFAPPPTPLLAADWWRAFPIVDADRCGAFATIVAFNDNFFMSLMFLVSGLFVWKSLERKGPARFLRDRVLRLGVPFVVSIVALAPLAYYPTYLQSGGHGIAEFARQYIALAPLPTGPAWFLWVLLAFDVLVAGVFVIATSLPALPRSPVAAFAIVVALSALAYIPLGREVGEMRWTGIGPLVLQIGRVAHYALYFAIGVVVGPRLDRSFVPALARWWFAWVALAAVAFYVAIGWETAAFMGGSAIKADLGFVLTCAASSFGLTAVFVRFASRPIPALDRLRDNAYGIYLLHYAAVSWLQYALLDAVLPAAAKGVVVTLGAIALACMASAILRRSRVIARVV
ncbi:MAG TPA: acyltransferase family protein [Kofleriaceae bacterium]|jgi:surface polysaccharide O-acyltransferase-like enzyme